MENLVDAVDHLRNRLGVFYWTLQRGGDREGAAEQLRDAIAFAVKAKQPTDPLTPSLFLQWQCKQLRFLLGTAQQALERLGLTPCEERQARERLVTVAF